MALPFHLATVSRGYADLTPEVRWLGAEAAAAAAGALGQLLGAEVEVRASATPATVAPRALCARLAVELPSLPGWAALDVEPALVVRLVDRLGGGDGTLHAAALTPIEQHALELFALVALDGACQPGGVEAALHPRLAAGPPPQAAPPGALDIELCIETRGRAGGVRGAARLFLPPEAVRALQVPAHAARSASGAAPPDPAVRVPVGVRSGTAVLTPDELEALAPGDVLLVDRAPSEHAALVLPGGFRVAGRTGSGSFLVEDMQMPTHAAQIPITLEVELTRVELPLGELLRLAPGAVLPLRLDHRGEVTLRAGDRAGARGELVEVDGAVGVRITSVEGAP